MDVCFNMLLKHKRRHANQPTVAVREEAAFGAGATSCITLARPLRVFTKPHALAIKLGSIHTTLFHVHKHALFDEVTTKSVTTVAWMITHFFGKIKGGVATPATPPLDPPVRITYSVLGGILLTNTFVPHTTLSVATCSRF